MYRYLLRHCGNAGIADELFQDVWMNVVRVRASYAPTAKFTTWLYTLAHNRLVDHWRANGQVGFVSIDDEDDDAHEPRRIDPGLARRRAGNARREQRDRRAGCATALAELPAVQREAFLLQQEADCRSPRSRR